MTDTPRPSLNFAKAMSSFWQLHDAYEGMPHLHGYAQLLQAGIGVFVPCGAAMQADPRQRFGRNSFAEIPDDNDDHLEQAGQAHCSLQFCFGILPSKTGHHLGTLTMGQPGTACDWFDQIAARSLPALSVLYLGHGKFAGLLTLGRHLAVSAPTAHQAASAAVATCSQAASSACDASSSARSLHLLAIEHSVQDMVFVYDGVMAATTARSMPGSLARLDPRSERFLQLAASLRLDMTLDADHADAATAESLDSSVLQRMTAESLQQLQKGAVAVPMATSPRQDSAVQSERDAALSTVLDEDPADDPDGQVLQEMDLIRLRATPAHLLQSAVGKHTRWQSAEADGTFDPATAAAALGIEMPEPDEQYAGELADEIQQHIDAHAES